ncbi:MAG: bifunctional DNA primase/polymerase [Candidatus Brocadiia bacterium]
MTDTISTTEVCLGAPELADSLLSVALGCIEAGVSIIPIDHTTKRPAANLLPTNAEGKPAWKPYQAAIADEGTVRQWFKTGIQSFAVVGGKVSGGLLILDFDAPEFYEQWVEAVGERANGLPVQRTGGGGYQVLLRCARPGGNDKLAWAQDEKEETGRTIAIETRGEGGYAVVAPSLHPSGNRYKMLVGSLTNIPVVPQARADALMAAARKLDQAPLTRQEQERLETQAREAHRQRQTYRPGQPSVIAAFNAAHPIKNLLQRYGYVKGAHGRYIRPGGKSESVSVKDGRSCHWSSNDPLNDGRGKGGCGCHDAFDIYAHFEHRGNVSKAVKAAADMRSTNSADDLPQLDAGDRNLPRITRAVWDAVVAQNEPPHLFHRAGQVVWIDEDDEGMPITVALDRIKFRHLLARVARWYRWVKGRKGEPPEPKDAAPPLDIVEDALALRGKPLPVLDGLAEAPVFAPDGTLVIAPGYSPESRLFYAPSARFVVPPVSAVPSEGDVDKARALIVTELLGDFPFTSETERAHALALLLHPFVRPLIAGSTPLHLIEKPTPGTGATLLADLLVYPALGRPPASLTEGRDEDEWRKRLTAAARHGGPVILIDNLRRRLDSSSVSSAITALFWEDRILGTSDTVRLPMRWAWIATGNNPALSSEITRRTVRIRLDAKSDRPWLRQGFRHPDIRRWAAEHRVELVWAALTLAQNWLAKGRPRPPALPTFGMFEAWSDVMGGILACAGIAGFLGNLDEFYECSDVEGEAWRNFVAAWFNSHGEREVGVAELYSLAATEDGSAPIDLGDGTEKSQKTRLGKALSAQRDRQFGAYRVVAGAKKDGAQQWKLLTAAERPERAEHFPPRVRNESSEEESLPGALGKRSGCSGRSVPAFRDPGEEG